MLDALRAEGVAAYVTPLDQEPDLLRLWVDAAAGGKTAGPAAGGTSTPDEDELWAQIVAGFDTEVADPVPRWPVAEDLEGGSEAESDTGNGRRGNVTRPGDGSFRVGLPTPGPRDWSPTDDRPEDGEPDELDEDPDDHFVPPPPPPLPKTDLATKVAWIALLGGPLFLLGAVMLGRPIGEWTTFLAIAACGGGFIALVSRLRRDHDEDDPDDGAVV
ncbi:MAG: hypothetical protein HOV68_32655, partial [Streptomycetaceae bacterium]|nr:hypothetical protein [Streptomycetaceae bacterium]